MSRPDFEVHQEVDAVAAAALVRVAVRAVAVGAIGVLAGGLILYARVGAIQPLLAGQSGPQQAPRELSRVEQTPIWTANSGKDLVARQRDDLQSWGWTERDAGLAHIPIERAMDLVGKGSL